MQPTPSMLDDDARWDAYWAQSLPQQPFYVDGLSFRDYAPALRLGRERWRIAQQRRRGLTPAGALHALRS